MASSKSVVPTELVGTASRLNGSWLDSFEDSSIVKSFSRLNSSLKFSMFACKFRKGKKC